MVSAVVPASTKNSRNKGSAVQPGVSSDPCKATLLNMTMVVPEDLIDRNDPTSFEKYVLKDYCLCSSKGMCTLMKAKMKSRARRRTVGGEYVTQCSFHENYRREQPTLESNSDSINEATANGSVRRRSSICSIPQIKECCFEALTINRHLEAEELFHYSALFSRTPSGKLQLKEANPVKSNNKKGSKCLKRKTRSFEKAKQEQSREPEKIKSNNDRHFERKGFLQIFRGIQRQNQSLVSVA